MGSSLGGICCIVLAWENPEVFGQAASLSGAFQVERTNFLNNILRSYQDKAKPARLYLDSGVVDFTGGDDGQKLTTAVAEELRRIGWGRELVHFVDAKPLTLPELEKKRSSEGQMGRSADQPAQRVLLAVEGVALSLVCFSSGKPITTASSYCAANSASALNVF